MTMTEPSPVVIEAPCYEDVSKHAGKHISPSADWTIIAPSTGKRVDVKKPDGRWLCKIWRSAVPEELCHLATECYMKVGKTTSTNRGFAAGVSQRNRSYSTYEKGAEANSGIMGYMDSANMTYPCRLTQFSRKHFEQYKRGLPFVQHMDSCFQYLMPEAYLRQKNVATKTQYHIEGTSFSTITVNYNFQTALHVDSGDFKEGFGTIAVCQNNIEGGWILFPGFKIAVVLGNGDFIAMDVHEWHCNTPIRQLTESGYRLSFVGYLREKMVNCDDINRRIAMAGTNGTLTSERMISDICDWDQSMGPKSVIGTGPQGHVWWVREGQRFCIKYKFKRYTITDKVQGVTYNRLTSAWEEIQKNE